MEVETLGVARSLGWKVRMRCAQRLSARDALHAPAGVTRRSLGPLPMRGKEQPIALYALKTMDGTE